MQWFTSTEEAAADIESFYDIGVFLASLQLASRVWAAS